jgi:hypothetical protein
MRTTEIFVEQVIIGGLVILIGYILFPQDAEKCLKCFDDTFAQISLGALMVGAAYLIGIVYDRFTDTMFQDLERHCRWSYLLSKKGFYKVLECVKLDKDPYPEHHYRIAILTSDFAVQKEEYFRRRLRLTRAFATLIPGVSIAIVLYMSSDFTNELWYKFKAALIPVAYLLAFLLKNTDWEFIRGEIPPKTDDFNTEKKKEKIETYCKNHKSKRKRSVLLFIFCDSACVVLFFIFWSITSVQTALTKQIKFTTVMLAGTILATIVTWAWWRIYHTYFDLLKDFSDANNGEQSK